MILHLPPTLVSRSGCSGSHDFTLVSHLFFALGGLGRVILDLSPACLPLWVLWAGWFYICLPLFSHLSPTLVFHSGCSGPQDFTFFSHLSPTCLPLVSHLSPTCLPLRVLWAAWFYMCLPLVSHTWLPFWMLWAAWFYTCLPLWVVWAAWFYICLPLVFTLDAI